MYLVGDVEEVGDLSKVRGRVRVRVRVGARVRVRARARARVRVRVGDLSKARHGRRQ